jgi:DNA-binding transcriptional ArsR family regulator
MVCSYEGVLLVSATLNRPAITVLDPPCCTPPGTPTVAEPEAETYAAWFKALADPTRIRILNLLATSEEPVCVCDITDHFPLGQPTISHHLKVLRDVRFVIAERRGTFMHYRVNTACLAEFPDAARRILDTNS